MTGTTKQLSGAATASAAAGAMSRSWMTDFILLGAIWGSSFLFTRIAAVGFGAVPTAAVRVMVAAVCLVAMLNMRGLGPQFRQHWKMACALGLLNSAIPFACFAFAVLTITTGLSGILNATVPLFAAIVAWIWLGDRPSLSRLFGLALGFGGIALLAWDQAGAGPKDSGIAPGWAVAACLLATLCYALAASAAKRYLDGVPALVTATGSQIGAAIGLAVPAIWFWPAHSPSVGAWLAVTVLGVVCTGLAYVLYFRLIDEGGPSRALAVTFLIPVFAVFYGAAFLGETVTGWMILCGSVVVCGTALATGWLKLGRGGVR